MPLQDGQYSIIAEEAVLKIGLGKISSTVKPILWERSFFSLSTIWCPFMYVVRETDRERERGSERSLYYPKRINIISRLMNNNSEKWYKSIDNWCHKNKSKIQYGTKLENT